MNRLLVIVLLVGGSLAAVGAVSGQEETIYFDQRFENDSTGEVLYETDFESGSDEWTSRPYIYYGSTTSFRTRQADSTLKTTLTGTVDSAYNGYSIYQERFIEFNESGTYHLYTRANAGFPEGQYDDSIALNRVEVDGNELPIETGREVHRTFDVESGNHSFTRRTQFRDPNGGRVNGTASIDHLAILRDSTLRFANWESDGFPMYTSDGIDGSSLFLRSATASINATPAQHHDPVVVGFDIRTSGRRANWSVEQSGYTIASGTIDADHSRTVKRTVSLQSGQFSLRIDSRDTVAVDNVEVLGYQEGSVVDREVGPTVPAVDRAAKGQGYETVLGGLNGLVSLGLDTATYLALGGIVSGSILFLLGRHRNNRGLALVVGASVLLLSVLVFAPILDTVAWVFTGATSQPSLQEPDLSATSMLYEDAFDDGSLASSDWTQIAGDPSDAYLDTGIRGGPALVLREGATVETTVTIDGSGLTRGLATIDTSVSSETGQAPPDRDALSVHIDSGGSTVYENSSAAVASGGDTTRTTVQRHIGIPGSAVTIRLAAQDTNGGDDRAKVLVTRVLLRGEV